MDAAMMVQQQQAFGHAVKEGGLLGLELQPLLDVGLSQLVQHRLSLALAANESRSPPKVQTGGARQHQHCQKGPKHPSAGRIYRHLSVQKAIANTADGVEVFCRWSELFTQAAHVGVD